MSNNNNNLLDLVLMFESFIYLHFISKLLNDNYYFNIYTNEILIKGLQ